MPKLSDKALRSREARLDSEPPPTTNKGEIARQAPPQKHGGVRGQDQPGWAEIRAARRAGFVLMLPGTVTEFVTEIRLVWCLLRGALRRAERGESRVEITLREVKLCTHQR